jgi:transcriptional regulator GlxA family with amidase domain
MASIRPQARRRSIAVVAFDRISAFHLSVPCLVFGEDRRELGVPAFELRVCAAEGGKLRTTAGFSLATRFGLGRLHEADIVIVPSWRDPDERPPERLLSALRRAHASRKQLVGLCLGAFVLAEAGLLDGRRATTHWQWADAFAARFPRVQLDRRVLYVDDDDIVTSAGTAAGLDCCLHLLRKQIGAELANRVARRLVLAPHRQGGQAQYIEQPIQRDLAADPLAETLSWAGSQLQRAHSLDSLAKRSHMSRRTFTRRFRQTTGTSVSRWLIAQRVAHAQRLLETSTAGIEQIASAAGFGSALSLRQHFVAALSVSPAQYRREFRLAERAG